MRIHVKIINEFWEMGFCEACNHDGISCMRQTLFMGSGSTTTIWRCSACWLKVETDDIYIEQANLAPGRTPPSKKDKRRAREQELRIASDIGGQRQPGSGNQEHAKGDVRKRGLLRGEAKYTRSKQFVLKRDELDKIAGECTGAERPFLHIEFRNPISNKVEDSWVVSAYEDWKLHNGISDNSGSTRPEGEG